MPTLDSSHLPRLVITAGLHGSASTWVFNVARELMLATVGEDSLVSFFGASPAAVLAQPQIIGKHIVCKTHGWPNLDVFAALTSAIMIVTIRDPRDCVLSYMERFSQPFLNATRVILNDCVHATACSTPAATVLRYEDLFFSDPAVVRLIAERIGVKVDDTIVGNIFDRYSTDSVRAFAAKLETLPRERLDGDGKPLLFDRVTHITRTHIGDSRVGKWRERFDDQQRAALKQGLCTIS